MSLVRYPLTNGENGHVTQRTPEIHTRFRDIGVKLG